MSKIFIFLLVETSNKDLNALVVSYVHHCTKRHIYKMCPTHIYGGSSSILAPNGLIFSPLFLVLLVFAI